MIVLDASVLIAHLAVDDVHQDRAYEIIDTEDELAIHAITLAEILVRPSREGRDEIVSGQIERLGVERLGWRVDEPLLLARLRAGTPLRMPDCCVLAAAEHAGATLATFDARLAEVARSRGVSVVGVA